MPNICGVSLTPKIRSVRYESTTPGGEQNCHWTSFSSLYIGQLSCKNLRGSKVEIQRQGSKVRILPWVPAMEFKLHCFSTIYCFAMRSYKTRVPKSRTYRSILSDWVEVYLSRERLPFSLLNCLKRTRSAAVIGTIRLWQFVIGVAGVVQPIA